MQLSASQLPVATEVLCKPSDSEGIHAEMHHPSIVGLFSVFRTPFARYHVLEYCAEGSLETLMPHVGNDLLFEVAGGIASALAYLHEGLVLHRNVWPGAILITHDKKAVCSRCSTILNAWVNSRHRNCPVSHTPHDCGHLPPICQAYVETLRTVLRKCFIYRLTRIDNHRCLKRNDIKGIV